jgi:hypothetical protein
MIARNFPAPPHGQGWETLNNNASALALFGDKGCARKPVEKESLSFDFDLQKKVAGQLT